VRVIGNSATLVQQLIHTVTAIGLLAGGDPVVLPVDAPPEQYGDAVREALADDGCDAIVCAAVAIFDSGTDAIHAALDDLARTAVKPLIGVLIDFDEYADSDSGADGPGRLPTFDSPADAIQALSALSAYAHWRERDPGAVPLLDVDELRAKRVVNRVLSRERNGRELTGPEAIELLAAYGIDLVPRYRVPDLAAAISVAERLGWDVVLKARSTAVRGRPDLAGVYRHLENADALREAWADLGELTAELGLGDDPVVADPVIQAMAPPGVPLIMTSREDAAFGPMLSLGLDGIASELLGDIVHRVPPLTTADSAAMVRDLRAAPTLFGRNGSPGVDVAAVQDLLHRLAQLADDLPQLASVRLSPVIASVSGVHVLGARVLIAPTGDQRDPMARTL
jgi:acyl-CoA synthetase (NDP forming)